MKVEHQLFESMLKAKGITKKAFSEYTNIPYYTVAGWKKSGKVPKYAMILLKNMPSVKMVTTQQLLDVGFPRAIIWNNDPSKEVASDIFIVATLRRAYNDFVIERILDFFGTEAVLAALLKHKDKVSDTLIQHVTVYIDNTAVSA